MTLLIALLQNHNIVQKFKPLLTLTLQDQDVLTNNLKTNNTKTKLVQFKLRPHPLRIPPITMVDDDIVKEVETVKFPGIYLDKRLTWENKINNVCSKVISGIFETTFQPVLSPPNTTNPLRAK